MAFDRETSILAGMSDDQVRAALAMAQKSLVDLQTGNKPVSVAYTQGNGSRSVTYTKAELPQLIGFIKLCQAQLGIVTSPRRPIRVVF